MPKFLSLVGWLCWLAAAVVFFIVVLATPTGATNWTAVALGLLASGFVLRTAYAEFHGPPGPPVA